MFFFLSFILYTAFPYQNFLKIIHFLVTTRVIYKILLFTLSEMISQSLLLYMKFLKDIEKVKCHKMIFKCIPVSTCTIVLPCIIHKGGSRCKKVNTMEG